MDIKVSRVAVEALRARGKSGRAGAVACAAPRLRKGTAAVSAKMKAALVGARVTHVAITSASCMSALGKKIVRRLPAAALDRRRL